VTRGRASVAGPPRSTDHRARLAIRTKEHRIGALIVAHPRVREHDPLERAIVASLTDLRRSPPPFACGASG
jgi:hypothetical protein